MAYQKIIIKIGTNVITKDNGLLDKKVIRQIVEQIAELRKKGLEVVVVSSGAMGAGRGLIKLSAKLKGVNKRQVLAAVGQAELINMYLKLFTKHKMVCAQVLATKEDFGDRRHYLNMRNCFESLLKENVIPIVNENDVVSVEELMFTDNDELASLIASMVNADILLLLTTTDGVLDQKGKVMPVVKSVQSVSQHISPRTSSFGRGGMLTKCRIAEKLGKLGIATIIAKGGKKNVLMDAISGKSVGTTFPVKKKRASSVKQWIAHSEGKERGTVTVNDCAEKILKDKKIIASLLPVGITRVTGTFRKGDMIKINNAKGESIGNGVTQYDSKKAKKFMGKKNQKALIHYDYLFIKK